MDQLGRLIKEVKYLLVPPLFASIICEQEVLLDLNIIKNFSLHYKTSGEISFQAPYGFKSIADILIHFNTEGGKHGRILHPILSNEDISRTGKIPVLELMGAAYIKHGTSQKAKNGLLCWRKAMELRQSTFPKILTSFPNELRRYLEKLASLKRWRNYIN